MILHMLSQRSDTDLLSAPKVVTKSGQEAIMKVVTEYIYPTEYEVQISQQSSSGSITTGGAADPLAIVEPQNFKMRPVGIILQVVPEVSAEGQMINLMLNPQVVSEPVWKNYGTKVPKTTYRAPTAEERILNPTATSIAQTEYIDLPMEQPFFHVRSVQTQLSVYNGATVVMGGLITEDRKTMEDKIPFLGDIPYLGRLFRSRSEQSIKRNLLVFVTARLVDPAGRVVKTGGESALLAAGASSTPSAPVAAPVAAQEGGAEPNAAAIQ
jgi:general secretion pathway protein D